MLPLERPKWSSNGIVRAEVRRRVLVIHVDSYIQQISGRGLVQGYAVVTRRLGRAPDNVLETFNARFEDEGGAGAAKIMRAVEEAIEAARTWQAGNEAHGQPAPKVNAAVATGRIIFGAVGDDTRLEYTVIGDAVNLSAKLEQFNKHLKTSAVCDTATYDLAQTQGYATSVVPAGGRRRANQAQVPGVGHPVDVVVLAS